MKYLRLIPALLLFAACATATTPTTTPVDAARAEVAKIIAEQKPPALSIAVIADGKLVWSEGFGLADLEQSVQATGKTRYRLGSVSKLYTAAIAVRLAARGVLDLDAPIEKYVPSFPHKSITARQLLGHTAGVRHYMQTDPIFAGKRYESLSAGLAIFANDKLLFEPGTGYHYTSYGFNLLGVVLENASGKTFAQLLAAEIGIDGVALDDNATIIPHRAAFYDKRADGTIVNAAENDSSYKWPSGGLVASAEDLARFAAMHLNESLIAEPLKTAMFTPRTLPDGKKTNVGLAWRIDTTPDGVRFYHHGGTITGGRAFVVVLPEERVAVAVLTNLLVRYGENEVVSIARKFAQSR